MSEYVCIMNMIYIPHNGVKKELVNSANGSA